MGDVQTTAQEIYRRYIRNKQSFGGRDGIACFVRPFGRQTSTNRRSECATASDKQHVGELLALSQYLEDMEAMFEELDEDEEAEARLSRQRRRERARWALELGLPLRKKRRREDDDDDDFLWDAAINIMILPLPATLPLQVHLTHPRCVSDYTESDCYSKFHLSRNELQRLVDAIKPPNDIITKKRSRFPREMATIFLLRKMLGWKVMCSDERVQLEFGRQRSCLSELWMKMHFDYNI